MLVFDDQKVLVLLPPTASIMHYILPKNRGLYCNVYLINKQCIGYKNPQQMNFQNCLCQLIFAALFASECLCLTKNLIFVFECWYIVFDAECLFDNAGVCEC